MTSTGKKYTIGRAEILQLVDSLREEFKTSQWKEALEFEGIDVWDAVRAHLFLSLLRCYRQKFHPVSEKLSFWNGFDQRLRQPIRNVLNSRKAEKASLDGRLVDMVFWPVEATHMNYQLPVARELRRQGYDCLFSVFRPLNHQQLVEKGEPSLYFGSLWKEQIELSKRNQEPIKKLLVATPSVDFDPFPFSLSEKDLVVNYIRSALINHLPHFFEALKATDLICSQLKPRVLIVGYDLTLYGRTACLRAKQLQVATACIMHGNVTADPQQGAHRADKILSLGDFGTNYIVERGQNPSQVVTCGPPNLDDWPRQSGNLDPQIMNHLGLSPQRPYILVATSGAGTSISHKNFQLIVDSLCQLSEQYPHLDFVVKLHPKDKAQVYYEAQKRLGEGRLKLVPFQSEGLPQEMHRWLQGCAAVFTCASTAAIEAMVMKVPVVTMDFIGDLRDIDFIDRGATYHAQDKEELREILDSRILKEEIDAAYQERVARFLKGCFFKLDGQASKRCVDVICLLAKDQEGLAFSSAGDLDRRLVDPERLESP